MRTLSWLTVWTSLGLFGVATAAEKHPLDGVHRIVFLGDSITYTGQYIENVETCLRLRHPKLRCEFLNLGLPSETVSGLSEPGHAGGAFPRPDLHERLDRVLKKTKPDLVVACYGMNCGMYYPYSEARFGAYKKGIIFLREQSKAAGARVIHLTPPVFDPVPIQSKTLPAGLAEYRRPFEGYNDVLDRYSEWLLSQRIRGWVVLDVHGLLNRNLREGRKQDPTYRLADDGVHIDDVGQWVIAHEILALWGASTPAVAGAKRIDEVLKTYPHGEDVHRLVQRKQRLLKDAWLTATGHKRPGMNPGLPLAEAQRQAVEIESQIKALLPRPD